MLYQRQMQPVMDKHVLSLDDLPSFPAKRSPEGSPPHMIYASHEHDSGSGSPPSTLSSSESYQETYDKSSFLESWDASQGAFGPVVSADALLSGQTIFGNAPGLLDHDHHQKPSANAQQDEMHSEFDIPVMITGAEWARQDYRQHQQHHHHHENDSQHEAMLQQRFMGHSASEYGVPEPSLLTQMWRQRGPATWRG